MTTGAHPGDAPRRALSPSRAADFMQCPLLYRFRTIDRLPETPSAAAARGTLVHAVLERLYDLPAAERTAARAGAMVEPQWRELLEREPRLQALFGAQPKPGTPTGDALARWLAGARALLQKYFALEDPTRLEPEAREMHVEVDLEDGPVLRGIVDRLDVTPAGRMRVVDYKTGRAPSETAEARALFQMRFYALVLWRLRGEVPLSLQLVYLGSGDVLRHTPDEGDLLATERKVRALWDAIERNRATGDWRPRPGRACTWCDHKVRCPSFGGTPPPLPVDLPLAPGPPAPAGADG
ncbi:putative RecB family exonuclease [Kineococcus radiotolerans]|uniref:RecB family exonuclease n=2 Tax=Kineococcus radiotolerans TaxID=131568 RepID=A6W952_KINRD|nr:PD-(D/E)XK nuclease family protein [Kineococcus radiotolerans]ABS03341.1 putative RecB family exonuclease [Kineococcus radiotolerans SRS30216 = ATCC BAA-149]MBB2899540.1 putative RecB family exonuclease [Kineococcus radiotolerans]